MADMVFEKRKNRRIVKYEGDYAIHEFVTHEMKRYEDVECFKNVFDRMGLIEPDPRVRDKILAHFFTHHDCVNIFRRITKLVTDEKLVTIIKEMKDHLTYLLFPVAPEFDRRGEALFGLGFGGALLRSVAHVPKRTTSYFVTDWK